MTTAAVFVTGPCLVYAGVSGGLARRPLFLGTCEDTPRVKIDHEWEPLFNSLGGSRIPMSNTYQGERALVQLDLTRWDQTPRVRIAAVPFYNGLPGFCPFGNLGALAVEEGATYPLWLRFPYSIKQAMAAQGMEAGYRFVAARLESDDPGNLNTKGRKISLVFACDRVFIPRNLSWLLYDSNMKGLPNAA